MFGLLLALGIPMAWWLFLTRRGIIRVISALYVPLAALGILLTASRTAFLTAVIASSVIPLTVSRKSLLSWVTAVWILLGGVGLAVVMVPQNIWDRIFTVQQELTSGTIGGRSLIWAAGWTVFLNRPMLGVGSGAFETSVMQLLGGQAASHNVFLAILVEQGIVGFCIFAAFLCACAWRIASLPPRLRSVWATIATIWMVGSMTANWQYDKVTWLLFALLAAQAAAHRSRSVADHVDQMVNRKSQVIAPALSTRRAS